MLSHGDGSGRLPCPLGTCWHWPVEGASRRSKEKRERSGIHSIYLVLSSSSPLIFYLSRFLEVNCRIRVYSACQATVRAWPHSYSIGLAAVRYTSLKIYSLVVLVTAPQGPKLNQEGSKPIPPKKAGSKWMGAIKGKS